MALPAGIRNESRSIGATECAETHSSLVHPLYSFRDGQPDGYLYNDSTVTMDLPCRATEVRSL